MLLMPSTGILKVAALTALIGMLIGCTTTGSISKDTFVRISNQSGTVLTHVDLGRRIIKGNSYSNTNYISGFGKVDDGEITRYRALKESHFGLDRFLIAAGRGGYTTMTRFLPVDSKNLQEALQQAYGVEFSVKHPYTKKNVTGYVLPPGNYTFVVTRDEAVAKMQPCLPRPDRAACEQGFVLEIQKDKAGS